MATSAAPETTAFLNEQAHEVPVASLLVKFGTMPGLVSHENVDSSGLSGSRGNRLEGGGIPSHCTQEEGLNHAWRQTRQRRLTVSS